MVRRFAFSRASRHYYHLGADFVALLKKGQLPPIALRFQSALASITSSLKILLAISPNRSDECHDRNPVKEKLQ